MISIWFIYLSFHLSPSRTARCDACKRYRKCNHHYHDLLLYLSVFGPRGVLNQRVNAAWLFPGWWCKENTRGLSWFGQKKALRPAGGEVCISLHRGARVGVTSRRERVSSPSLKEKKGERSLLEMLISCFLLFGRVVVSSCFLFVCSFAPPCRTLAYPFYKARGGQAKGSLEVMLCRFLLSWLWRRAFGMASHPWVPWRYGRQDDEMTQSATSYRPSNWAERRSWVEAGSRLDG
jgi:hypothetical protein